MERQRQLNLRHKQKNTFSFARQELIINDCWYKVKKNCDSCNDKSKGWYINVPVVVPAVVPVKLIEVLKQTSPHNGFGQVVTENQHAQQQPFVQPMLPPSSPLVKKATANGNCSVTPPISKDTPFVFLDAKNVSVASSATQHTVRSPSVTTPTKQSSTTNGSKNGAVAPPVTNDTENECIVLDDDDEDEAQPANNQKEIAQQSTENLRFSKIQKSRILAKIAAKTIEQQIKTTTGSELIVGGGSCKVTKISDQVELSIVPKLAKNSSGRKSHGPMPTVECTAKLVEYVVHHELPTNDNDDNDLTLAELQERHQGINEKNASTTAPKDTQLPIACIDLDDDDGDDDGGVDAAAPSNDNAEQRSPNSPHVTEENDTNNDLLVEMKTETRQNTDSKEATARDNSETEFITSDCEPAIGFVDKKPAITTPKEPDLLTFEFNEQLLSLCEISMTGQSTAEYTVTELPTKVMMPNIPHDQVTAGIDDTGDGNSSGPHQCHVCWQSFERKCKLTTHLRNSETCSAMINKTLTDTVTQFTDTRPYECDICHRRFSGLHFIEQHMFRSHSGTSVRRCRFCRKEFPTPKSLRRHTKSHLNKKNQFRCDRCGKELSTMQGLIVHQRLHTGEMPYKCNVCNKPFRVLSSLSIHVRTHTNVRPYKCDICNRSFSQSTSMQNHRFTHTGKPFSCELCPKTFSMARLLALHRDSRHSGIEKPYHCDICQKSSWSLSSLRQHMKRHSGKYGLKCLVCLKTFCNVDSLEKHSQRKHSEGGGGTAMGQPPPKLQQFPEFFYGWMTCEVCNVLQPDSVSMEVHMETHRTQVADGNGIVAGTIKIKQEPNTDDVDVKPFKCTHCLMVFSQSANFERHMKLHRKTGRPLQSRYCTVCKRSMLMTLKMFNLHQQQHRVEAERKAAIQYDSEHCSTEIDLKPFKCTNCVMVFSSSGNLERHMALHKKKGRPLRMRHCTVCNESQLWSLKSFAAHQQLHNDGGGSSSTVTTITDTTSTALSLDKPFKCKICRRTFAEQSQLATHEYATHAAKTADNRYKCCKCHKSMSSAYQLREHMHRHSGEKPYTCKICDKRFAQNLSMHFHIRRHHPEATQDFRCDLCDKSYARHISLLNHRKTHENAGYRCKYCDTELPTQEEMITHFEMHTGDTPYLCVHCNERFAQRHELKSHSYLHSDMLPIQCVTCKKMFANESALSNHMKLHDRRTTFDCVQCDKQFTTKVGYENHMVRHNRRKRQFKCDMCLKMFWTKMSLVAHKRRHNVDEVPMREKLECPVCQKTFMRTQTFENHLRKHAP